jgi:hypothetical protein
VRADSRELRVARRDAEYARASEQAGLERIGLIGELRRLEQQARAGDQPDQLADELGRVVGTLLPATQPDEDEDAYELSTTERGER